PELDRGGRGRGRGAPPRAAGGYGDHRALRGLRRRRSLALVRDRREEPDPDQELFLDGEGGRGGTERVPRRVEGYLRARRRDRGGGPGHGARHLHGRHRGRAQAAGGVIVAPALRIWHRDAVTSRARATPGAGAPRSSALEHPLTFFDGGCALSNRFPDLILRADRRAL